ncbi:MAG: ImmA/IrrE family metallo-endopeptidase [Candidatus Aminicenantes bacterium]|nr:ImmA/IrrE family metallo-endopeptidase [Candidatus Aminicenantes bacterium]
MNKKEVFAKQLKAARRMANMSMADLAEALGGKIKKQSIGKYEKGIMLPSSENLIALAETLKVPVDYFFKQKMIRLESLAFRKKAKLKNKDYHSIVEKTRDFIERYLEIEALLNIRSSFSNPLPDNFIVSKEDIERAVVELRKNWQVGIFSPIHKVIELLERNYIKIIELEVSRDFDGLSTVIQDIPVIVINKNFDNVRKRFTALHELAHLIFRFDSKLDPREIEKMCHYFAGAFLMPKEIFVKDFSGSRSMISLFELVKIKENYGISIQALMARAKDLHIITANRYKDFCIKFGKSGYRKSEPGNYPVNEYSNRFELLIYRALSEEIISFSKASSLSGKSIDTLYKEFNI